MASTRVGPLAIYGNATANGAQRQLSFYAPFLAGDPCGPTEEGLPRRQGEEME